MHKFGKAPLHVLLQHSSGRNPPSPGRPAGHRASLGAHMAGISLILSILNPKNLNSTVKTRNTKNTITNPTIAAVIMPSEESVYNGGEAWKSESDSSTDDFIHEQEKEKNEWTEPPKYNSEKNKLVIGAVLVGLGILFLVKQFMPHFDYKILVPVLLIGIGGLIIVKGRH